MLLAGTSATFIPNVSLTHHVPTDQDSDSDSDLSLDEERSLSIPSSESEENVRLRGRFQRQLKRAAHSERLLTNPANTTPKGKSHVLAGKTMSSMTSMSSDVSIAAHGNLLSLFSVCCVLHQMWTAMTSCHIGQLWASARFTPAPCRSGALSGSWDLTSIRMQPTIISQIWL